MIFRIIRTPEVQGSGSGNVPAQLQRTKRTRRTLFKRVGYKRLIFIVVEKYACVICLFPVLALLTVRSFIVWTSYLNRFLSAPKPAPVMITINVSGRKFQIDLRRLKKYPTTLLGIYPFNHR